MDIRRGHLYLVDFNPRIRTKNESFRRELGMLDTDRMRELERRIRIVLEIVTPSRRSRTLTEVHGQQSLGIRDLQ